MRDNLTRTLRGYAATFRAFSPGQKAVAVVGTAALVLGAFFIFRWASTPTYAPLYSNLSGSDASAVVDELNKEGVKYQLADAGQTVMVPQSQVYAARIALAGKNLPSNSSSGGYSILDHQSLSTSDFQEQTDFKRAMEGELTKTIEAMNGVAAAVVHLAIPQKQVFSDQQSPTTASVLIEPDAGVTLTDSQVQAIVHLVAASIDGLDPKNVTVADSNGNVLSTPDNSVTGSTGNQMTQVNAFQTQMQQQIQSELDKIVGPGNSTVNVTADLNFDQTSTDTRQYIYTPNTPPLSQSSSVEKYNGTGSFNSGTGGVVGPDGQMDPTAGVSGGANVYSNGTTTQDNAVGTQTTKTESAPGGVKSLHIGVVLDARKMGTIQPSQVAQLISAATGINTTRGDTINVSSMPFDTTAATTAAKELAAQKAATASAQRWKYIREGGIAAVIALMVLLAWFKARRRSKAREEATSYVVEQLRADAAARAEAQALEASQSMAALEPAEPNPAGEIREELYALVERQPEDVAALLRGWLVEPRS